MRLALTTLVLALVIPAGTAAARPDKRQVERGRYLATFMGCNDCHTPMKLGPDGPAPDTTRTLSGPPAAPASSTLSNPAVVNRAHSAVVQDPRGRRPAAPER